MRRLRQVLQLSALMGLLSGLGEGVIDLTAQRVYPPEILYITVLANLIVFLILGFLFWLFGLGLEPQLAYFLVFFILMWACLHGWESEVTFHKERDLFWLLSLIGTFLIAVCLSLLAWKYSEILTRKVGQTLPWIIGVTLLTWVTIPIFRVEMKHRATSLSAIGSLPNIVLVVVDSLRADHMSCYHYQRFTTPTFDQLAANGVLFENAVATSSWTLPSHASMLTGLYPNQHHAQRFRDKLEVAIPTISEELERTGYRTGAFSGSFFFTPRQGLGRGFNEFGDFSFSPAQAFTQVYYVYSIIRHLGMAEWVEENIGHPSAPRITDSVMDWIDQGHQPFFFDGELF